MAVKTIEWRDDKVRMIDQRLLPGREIIRVYRDWRGVAEAIRTMVIRGAPAIGVAAAMGVALGMRGLSGPRAYTRFAQVAKGLRATRPTAVNLAWAVERMGRVVNAASRSTRRIFSAACATRRWPSMRKTLRPTVLWGVSARLCSRTLNRAHALQCRRARHGGLWHRARRGARRARGGQEVVVIADETRPFCRARA